MTVRMAVYWAYRIAHARGTFATRIIAHLTSTLPARRTPGARSYVFSSHTWGTLPQPAELPLHASQVKLLRNLALGASAPRAGVAA